MQIHYFDFQKIWRWLIKEKVKIIAASIITAFLFYFASMLLIKPVYRTEFTVFVNNKSPGLQTEQITNADTAAAQSLTQTYAAILKNRDLINLARENSKTDPADVTYSSVDTSIYNGTQLINVSVNTRSPENGYKFATAFAECAPEYIGKIIEGTSMTVVSAPVEQTVPFWPNHKKHAAIGFVIGFVLACMVVILKNLLKKQVESGEELVAAYNLPILGRIPFIEEVEKNA